MGQHGKASGSTIHVHGRKGTRSVCVGAHRESAVIAGRVDRAKGAKANLMEQLDALPTDDRSQLRQLGRALPLQLDMLSC